MPLNSNLMYHFVKDALRTYSDDFIIFDFRNPVQIGLNGHKYSIHVSYVHDSGNKRTNPEERRIQIGRNRINQQQHHLKDSFRTAFLGFFQNGDVFVAWDPEHVYSLKGEKVMSVYARESQRLKAIKNNSAVHPIHSRHLGANTFAIALQSQTLGFYLENIEGFHRLPNAKSIADLSGKFKQISSDDQIGGIGNFTFGEDDKREKFVFERKSFPRDPLFKYQVMNAYKQACCVCNRQLGLVQAAHIIPHSIPDSPKDVRNGLALCVEHHKLYDDGLLLPGPNRKLIFNRTRAKYLSETNQDEGLGEIESLGNREYSVPEDTSQRPLDEYLATGLRLRQVRC